MSFPPAILGASVMPAGPGCGTPRFERDSIVGQVCHDRVKLTQWAEKPETTGRREGTKIDRSFLRVFVPSCDLASSCAPPTCTGHEREPGPTCRPRRAGGGARRAVASARHAALADLRPRVGRAAVGPLVDERRKVVAAEYALIERHVVAARVAQVVVVALPGDDGAP